jgi:hypothetical protein
VSDPHDDPAPFPRGGPERAGGEPDEAALAGLAELLHRLQAVSEQAEALERLPRLPPYVLPDDLRAVRTVAGWVGARLLAAAPGLELHLAVARHLARSAGHDV